MYMHSLIDRERIHLQHGRYESTFAERNSENKTTKPNIWIPYIEELQCRGNISLEEWKPICPKIDTTDVGPIQSNNLGGV